LLAGLIGSLTGLGGGIIITPLLTLVVGVDIHYAIGAALVSVIATSCGAASAYVKEGLSNVRLGMFMEVATTTGALIRASLALRVSTAAIAELFGAVLFIRAGLRFGRARSAATEGPDAAAMSLELDSGYPTASGFASYHVHHILGGTGVMLGAGMLSSLLGIGSGAFKVIAFDKVIRVAFKVSTTTSHFMIGVAAAASLGLYCSAATSILAGCVGCALWFVLRRSYAARHENQRIETCICSCYRGARDRNDF
jgi:uncharacterized membrane protein YfcA